MAEKGEDQNDQTASPRSEDEFVPSLNDGPDIAVARPSPLERNQFPDTLPAVADNPPRREENPFSFKRFLNQDRGGVRRKEYSPDGAPVLLNTPEISSVLPDFVQDHLVVEQCYLSSQKHNPIPFDLPLPADDRPDAVPKSLPDFLNDGPIHSHRGDTDSVSYLVGTGSSASNGLPSPTGTVPRLRQTNEVDRLQREVDSLRRQLMERSRRVEILESEMSLLHSRDARETTSLEHALQQVESNLRQTSKRMTTAENAVTKLKSENKMLKAELQLINESQGGRVNIQPVVQNQRLAQDLRSAATAAEVHLRALMSGIDNLRMLASNVEERTDIRQYDNREEGATGPAL